MRRLDEELREEELLVDDDERAGIILPLDCKKQHHSGSDPTNLFFNDVGDFIMDQSDDSLRIANPSPQKQRREAAFDERNPNFM